MEEQSKIGQKLAPFNPTNVDAIRIAFDLLKLDSSDILYDLGCGDGRLLIEGSRLFNLHSIGVEYDLDLCEKASRNIEQSGLSDKAKVYHANVVDVSIDDATAIFIYLVPEGMRAMQPALVAAIARGVRIVSYVFSIPDLIPKEVSLVK